MQPEHPAPNRVREDKTIPMESSEHCLKYERGVIWFDDGSMIIVVEATAFRVFKGIMVQHSEVFCDMFAVPQPADVETWEGCPVIHVSDTKADIVHILSVIFDINYAGAWPQNRPLPFTTVSAMLRLGIKYNMDALRQNAMDRLQWYFPTRCAEFVNFHARKSNERANECTDTQIFYQDAIHIGAEATIAVIIIARSHNLPMLLPVAFYIAAQLSHMDMVQGYTDDDGKHWTLSTDDVVACLDGRKALQSRSIDQLKFIFSAQPAPTCSPDSNCQDDLYDFRNFMVNAVTLAGHTNPLSSRERTVITSFCPECKSHFDRQFAGTCEDIWRSPPPLSLDSVASSGLWKNQRPESLCSRIKTDPT